MVLPLIELCSSLISVSLTECAAYAVQTENRLRTRENKTPQMSLFAPHRSYDNLFSRNTKTTDWRWKIHLKINTWTFQDRGRTLNSWRELKATRWESEECKDRLNATGEKFKETDKREQEESECLARAAMLPSLFPSQLVVLVISRLCFSSHILVLTYS